MFGSHDPDGVSSSEECDVYGWYTGDGGTTWTEVGPIVNDISDGAAHIVATSFDGELWLGYVGWNTITSTVPTNNSWSSPTTVGGTCTGGNGDFYVEGSDLYFAIAQNNLSLNKYDGTSGTWSEIDSATGANGWDATLLKVGSNYLFAYAPWVSPKQWIEARVSTSLSNILSTGSTVQIAGAQYGTNTWINMWPVGFTDNGGDKYLFYTSERNPSDPLNEGTGNIWYLEVDWDVSRDHYTYIQEAVDAASDGDTINVAAGNGYHGAIIDKEVVVDGADGGTSLITSGVPYKSGSGLTTAFRLDAGADDTEIRDFTIQCDQSSSFYFGVFSRGVNNVIVDSLTVNDSVQGITNWGGSNWEITNNDLTDTVAAGGGGIAIFLGAKPTEQPVCSGNLVQNNVMSSASTEVGYTSPGIFFGLDARGNTIPGDLNGSEDVSENQIVENSISGTGSLHEVGIETGVIGVRGDSAAVAATMGIVHDNDVQTNTVDHSDYGLYAYIVKDLTVTGNVIKNCATHGVSIWDDFTGEINYNNIQDNSYGLYNDVSTRTIDAENNWWGDASGPGPVGPGSGDNVSANVDYDPWLAGIAPGTLQAAIDAASPGDVIYLGPYTYEGGIIINKSVTLQGQEGTVIGPGSPSWTVNADDIVIKDQVIDGDPTDTGTNSSDPGILVKAGADNLTVENCEIKRWKDGIQVEGDVISLKVVGNWIHDNTDAGLQVDSGVDVDGTVTIEGNLFKDNGGNGIQNNGDTTNLPAQYNSWGHISGAASGDGVGSNVDVTNPTFAELFLDVNPETLTTTRAVNESQVFTVAMKVDAAGLYGVDYHLTYSDTLLTLNQVTDGPFKGSGNCAVTETVGAVTVHCSRQGTDADAGGTSLVVNQLCFTATGPSTGNGPWTNYFDIYTATTDLAAGAQGGIKVYVNNGGFGSPSASGLRTITDTNDGQIDITGIAKFTGFIDLQGRTNDSGATVDVYDQTTKADATKLASGASASGGGYTTDYVGSYLLTLGTTYWFQIDAPLYLPTTPTTPVTETAYYDSHALDTRPLTTLNNVKLLGGDATNDNTISLGDATCIGGDYGQTSGFTECGGSGSGGTSDVNGDNVINILDLVLMGGNYSLSSSSWTP